MPDSDSGRVTMAIVAQKLDALIQRFDEFRAEQKDCYRDHEVRLRELEDTTRRQGERLNIMAGLHTALTVCLSAVASWLGIRS